MTHIATGYVIDQRTMRYVAQCCPCGIEISFGNASTLDSIISKPYEIPTCPKCAVWLDGWLESGVWR